MRGILFEISIVFVPHSCFALFRHNHHCVAYAQCFFTCSEQTWLGTLWVKCFQLKSSYLKIQAVYKSFSSATTSLNFTGNVEFKRNRWFKSMHIFILAIIVVTKFVVAKQKKKSAVRLTVP